MRLKSSMALASTTALAGLLLASCGSEEADVVELVELGGVELTDGAERCAAFAVSDVLGTQTAEASWVEADEESDMPAFCEVKATLSPVEGSNIGVVFRLPANWNGKMLGLGGGGWAGNVSLFGAGEGLRAGYATAQTDGGHPGTDVWDNSWAPNPEAATDFQHRAVHETAVAGKQVIDAFYERPEDRAYFQGCSTGGRMALMEAQRYPDDYEAIISHAPVYSLQVQSSSVLRNNAFNQPGAAFSQADLELVHGAVLKQCDKDDGLEDGLVSLPRGCGFAPASLQCTGAKDATCLSETQVATLETMYEGVRAPDNTFAQLPLSKGGEDMWSMFIDTGGTGNDVTNGGGMVTLKDVLFGPDSDVDYKKLTPAQVVEARASAFAKAYEAIDPNLSAFFDRGGKLLMWHGESDGGPSPVATIDYFGLMQQANSEAAASSARLFLSPGVGHCSGGPGADVTNSLNVLDEWVSSGAAPETIIATKRDNSLTRKLCAYPQTAQYGGEGDPNDPANWQCVARTSL
jgi:feruloyl esterase